jgi:hypothetical protein
MQHRFVSPTVLNRSFTLMNFVHEGLTNVPGMIYAIPNGHKTP